MTTQQTQVTKSYDGWIGRNAYDQSGDKLGEITDIYYDDRTGRPEWVGVKTGLFGSKTTFVPIHGAQMRTGGDADDDQGLQLAFDADQVKGAPRIDTDNDHMSPDEERNLWSYYGYDYDAKPDLKTAGYGTSYQKKRPDQDYEVRRYDAKTNNWAEPVVGDQARAGERVEEVTEEVPVSTTATVEVPVEANVRLRRYQTTQQKTRTVEIPYTETTEHTEVAGMDAKTKGATKVSGGTTTGSTTRDQPRR